MNTALDRQPSAVPHGARPRWSILVPTYRPSELLRDAIVSAEKPIVASGEAAQLEIVDGAAPNVEVSSFRSWGADSVSVHRRITNDSTPFRRCGFV